MKKIFFLLSIFLISFQLSAQNLSYAKDVVKNLTSKKMCGRGYVKNGNSNAAKYLIQEYKRFSLQTINGTFSQPFNIKVNTFPSSMFLKINDKILTPGADYLIDPYSPSLKGTFDVIHIKKESLLNQDSLRWLLQSSANKIIVIDETQFSNKDKSSLKKANEIISFLKYSRDISCNAVIQYTNEKLTWDIASEQAVRPSFTIHKKLDISEIKKISIHAHAKLITYQTQNICGYIKGTQQPDSFLVITAHYDHLGMMGSKTYFPGANDNASGIAMLLNLAQYFQAHPPAYSILFISLSAEELGLIGAKYFVNHPLIDLDKIKFLVNFDLAGTGDDGIKVVNGSIFKSEFNALKKMNQDNNYLPSVQIRGEACNSDHCMFYQKGVPCFYIYTLGGIRAYHDIYDRYETLPFTEFEDYCKLMIDFIQAE